MDNGLSCLSAAADASQRIGRLAPIVNTQNHTTHDPYAAMSDAELAAELERLGVEPAVQ